MLSSLAVSFPSEPFLQNPSLALGLICLVILLFSSLSLRKTMFVFFPLSS